MQTLELDLHSSNALRTTFLEVPTVMEFIKPYLKHSAAFLIQIPNIFHSLPSNRMARSVTATLYSVINFCLSHWSIDLWNTMFKTTHKRKCLIEKLLTLLEGLLMMIGLLKPQSPNPVKHLLLQGHISSNISHIY